MRRFHKALVLLVGPVLSLVLRIPFVVGREAPYGFDPYYHLHIINAWLSQDTWPLMNPYGTIVRSDYHAWPGFHIFVSAISRLTGLEAIHVLQWMPLAMMFLMVMALVLTCLRWTDIYIATMIGIVASLADHLFLQTNWFVPETMGLTLTMCLVLAVTCVKGKRVHIVGLVILSGMLLVHHFSLFIAVIYYLMMNRERVDVHQSALAGAISLETVAFWGVAMRATGSFPDIQDQLGGPAPGLLVAAMAFLLLVVKWVISKFHGRYVEGHQDRSFFGFVRERLGRYGLIAAIGGIFIVILVTFVIFYPSLARLDGTGAQPAKLALVIGIFLFLIYVPLRMEKVGYAMAFGAVFLLFLLTPVLFEFLPLRTRFLEFLYLSGYMLAAFGFYHLYKANPRTLPVVIVAFTMLVPVMMVDDHVRLSNEYSKRFEHSEEDVAFAEMIGDLTEEDAIIVTPFCYSPVVSGVAERWTRTHPVRVALDNMDYEASLPYLEELTDDGPVYLVHSTNWILYLETEDDRITEYELSVLGSTLDELDGELELMLVEGDLSLYRYVV